MIARIMDAAAFRQRVSEIHQKTEAAIKAAREQEREALATLALEFAEAVEGEQAISVARSAQAGRFVEPSAPTGPRPTGGTPQLKKLKRGEIDDYLERMLPEWSGEEITTLSAQEQLSERFPGLEFNRSTVYGALERLAQQQRAVVTFEGGKGIGNQRRYWVLPAEEVPEA